jgi:hypothetical protein
LISRANSLAGILPVTVMGTAKTGVRVSQRPP